MFLSSRQIPVVQALRSRIRALRVLLGFRYTRPDPPVLVLRPDRGDPEETEGGHPFISLSLI